LKITILRNISFKFLSDFSHSETTENLLAYKRLKARVRRLMKDATKKSWEEFTESVNEETTTREKIRRISG
jgi:hypothetical protein